MKCIPFFFLFILSFQSTEAQEKYIDSLFEVDKVRTEIYAEKENEELIFDLYQPVNSDSNRPLIVFMHGGGFGGGSPKNPQEIKFAKIAAAKGYTVALISYRLIRKDKKSGFGCDFEATGKIETFQLAAEDFMDAVNYIKTNAEEFKINPEHIIVGGSSAGAEAVLNAVYNPDLMFEDVNKYEELKFSAVISLAGALVDVRYLSKDDAIPGIFFHGTDDNLVPYATAPHHYCDKEEPGYLILDGSKTIVDKLKDFKSSYLFYSFNGARHEISGMPFKYLPEVFDFLNEVVFRKNKIQSTIYK